MRLPCYEAQKKALDGDRLALEDAALWFVEKSFTGGIKRYELKFLQRIVGAYKDGFLGLKEPRSTNFTRPLLKAWRAGKALRALGQPMDES